MHQPLPEDAAGYERTLYAVCSKSISGAHRKRWGPARQSLGGLLVFLFTDFQHDPLDCYKVFSIPLMILRSY
jgi:hypothetical protein